MMKHPFEVLSLRWTVLLAGIAALGLTGCAPKRMKADFLGFEKAYAETSNREMLLNLARLQNRDPTYFFKLGQISSTYRMQLSAASTLTSVAAQVAGAVNKTTTKTATGNPGVILENNGAVTFIPVNDETNAQLLLKPIPSEMFYILYQQGWRIDQLFRLMVDRIELASLSKDGCTVDTIRNLPPADSADSARLDTYIRFLRVSAIVYALQKQGLLLLRGSNVFVPFSADAPLASPPNATEMVNAAAKNAVWQMVKDKSQGGAEGPTGASGIAGVTRGAMGASGASGATGATGATGSGDRWYLGEKVFRPVFYLSPSKMVNGVMTADHDAIRKDILSEPDMGALEGSKALENALDVLGSGFSVAGTPEGTEAEEESCARGTEKPRVTSHLVMRSLMGIMAAAAQEEEPFSAIHKNPRFVSEVPRVEQIPLLRMTWKDEQPTPPLVELNYRGISYQIADRAAHDVSPENEYWNRDVFRLINQLVAQVTVDISKFPLPEILQLQAQ